MVISHEMVKGLERRRLRRKRSCRRVRPRDIPRRPRATEHTVVGCAVSLREVAELQIRDADAVGSYRVILAYVVQLSDIIQCRRAERAVDVKLQVRDTDIPGAEQRRLVDFVTKAQRRYIVGVFPDCQPDVIGVDGRGDYAVTVSDTLTPPFRTTGLRAP